MPKTAVSVTESTTQSDDGTEQHRVQYRTTIPKDLAEFFDMDRDTTLEWSTGSSRDKLEITVHTSDGRED